MLAKRSMYGHNAINEFMVQKGVVDASQIWKWWKSNLLDVDSDVGAIFVKTRLTAATAIQVHDLSRKIEDSKLALRTHIIERVKGILTELKPRKRVRIL